MSLNDPLTAPQPAQPPERLARPLARRTEKLPQTPMPAQIESNIPEAALAAAMEALARGETHYTDRPGILPLRQLASERLKRQFGIAIPAKDITITCGATEARFITIKVFAKPESALLCPGETAHIAAAAHLAGARLVPDLDAVPDPRAISALYLTPASDRYVVADALALARVHSWWIIWDLSAAAEPGDFHPGEDAALLPRLTTIDDLSAQMPGWRVGWMAGSEMAERLRSFKQSMTICTTSVSQWAAVEMLK